jgi:hypothetical protein
VRAFGLPSRTTCCQLAGVAVATALVRVPFMGSLGPDEGGYAYVASRWQHGQALYRSLWIDRPQALLLVYRALITIDYAVWAIRLGAVLAGVAVALLLIPIGQLVASRTVGLLAAVLYAFVGIGPRIEGYTFNGELAAAVPSTAAVAAGLVAWRRESSRWFVFAGALGGCALLMKQSGFDGLVVVLVLGASGANSGRRLVAAAAGAAVPIGASLIGGLTGGWHSYWSDLVASHVGSANLDVRLSRLGASLPGVTRDLLPLALVAIIGAWRVRGSAPGRGALAWLVAALVAVNVGGLYWPHYYVQLLPPLALLAGAGLARLSAPRAWAAAAVLVFPALFFVGNVVASPDTKSDRLVKYAIGFDNDAAIAHYVHSHSRPRDLVYAYDSRADFYFLAQRRAAFPYLWAHPLQQVPGARAALERTLSGARRPRFVVLFQQPPPDPFGREIRSILTRDYKPAWRAPTTGTEVLASRQNDRH